MSKILRIINSAYYGLRQEVRSVEHAVNYLGIQQIRNLVVSSALVESFRFDHGVIEPRCVWEHSLGCAIGAKRIGDLLPRLDGDQAYLGGLLHDIGRIFLLSKYPDRYGEVVAVSERGLMTLRSAERSHFGGTHEEIGFELGKSWGFSDTVLAAVRHHHAAAKAGELAPLVAVVSFANAMCHEHGLRFGFELDDDPVTRIKNHAWEIIQASHPQPELLYFEELEGAALASLDETRDLVSKLFG
jgi:putative nucleotidyltransferase with HDIG domain